MTDPVKYDEQAALEDCSSANGRRSDHSPCFVETDPELEAMFFAALMLGVLSVISLANAESVFGHLLGVAEGVAAVAFWKASRRSA